MSCIKCNYWTEVQKKYNYCSACRNNGGTTVKTGKYIPKTKKKVVETFNVGWDGNDRFGFHAIPGGIRSVDSDNEGFVHNGKGCYFWSTTIDRDKWAEMTYVMSNDKSYWTVSVSRRESGLSVRCIKD